VPGEASERLTRALLDLASKGLRPHCSDAGTSSLWLPETEAERAEACKLCAGCPIHAECGASAEALGERWGVWAGRDYTVRPGDHDGRSKQRDAGTMGCMSFPGDDYTRASQVFGNTVRHGMHVRGTHAGAAPRHSGGRGGRGSGTTHWYRAWQRD
jgi:hypothetical protein